MILPAISKVWVAEMLYTLTDLFRGHICQRKIGYKPTAILG
jgi:hypothetical protein